MSNAKIELGLGTFFTDTRIYECFSKNCRYNGIKHLDEPCCSFKEVTIVDGKCIAYELRKEDNR